MKRPSLHVRNRALRNLRAGPSFLTEARVAGLLAWLDSARTTAPIGDNLAAIEDVAPEPVAAVALPAPEKPKRVRTSAKPLVAKPVAATLAKVTFRIRRAKPVVDTISEPVAPVRAPQAEPTVDNAARIRAAMTAQARSEAAPITEQRAPMATVSAVEPAQRARPSVRIVGIQNGAAAIHWLRTHGVSVKAASTTVLGTRYLVSNEFGEQDVAAVVAIARRKGFAG